jgi:hypothetical protein
MPKSPKPGRQPPVLAFTVPELATGAQVSETKVWQDIASGFCPSCLIGDLRRITPAQAQTYLKRCERRAAEVRRRRAEDRGTALQPDLLEG